MWTRPNGGGRFDEIAVPVVTSGSYPALLQQARVLLARRDYDEAISILRDASSYAPEDAAPSCLIAQCELGMNRPDDGLRAADDAIALAPDNVWAHRLRAQALRALGRHDEAREAADVAANLPVVENLSSLTTRLLRSRRQRLVRSLPEMDRLIAGTAAWTCLLETIEEISAINVELLARGELD